MRLYSVSCSLLMEKPGFNHVRTFRQRNALSEGDLGFLIGRSQSTVSSTELGDSVPNLDAALALQVLFHLPPKELFPAYYEKVEERVMRQTAMLIDALERELDRKSDRRLLAKLEFLEGLASGANDIDL